MIKLTVSNEFGEVWDEGRVTEEGGTLMVTDGDGDRESLEQYIRGALTWAEGERQNRLGQGGVGFSHSESAEAIRFNRQEREALEEVEPRCDHCGNPLAESGPVNDDAGTHEGCDREYAIGHEHGQWAREHIAARLDARGGQPHSSDVVRYGPVWSKGYVAGARPGA